MKRKKLRFFALALLSLTLSIGLKAQNEKINMGDRFQINKDASYVTFETSFAGFPAIRGSISAYQANIFYDPAHPERTSATIRFGSSSVSSAHPKRDEELVGANFLDAENHPGMWFTSTKATVSGNGITLDGDLYIKGITKPVQLKLEKPNVMRKGMGGRDLMMAKGGLSFNRKDFQLGVKSNYPAVGMLGDQIDIEFVIVGSNYTIDYLKSIFVGKTRDGKDNPVGLIYNEVIAKGQEAGEAEFMSLVSQKEYKGTNWLSVMANLGWILMVDGHGKEAVHFFNMALSKDPNHFVSLIRLGDALVIAGDHAGALKHYMKEYSLDPRVRFTHLPEMIKQLSGQFALKNMK